MPAEKSTNFIRARRLIGLFFAATMGLASPMATAAEINLDAPAPTFLPRSPSFRRSSPAAPKA